MILKYVLLPWFFRLGANPTVMVISWRFAQLLSFVWLDWIVYSIINTYNYYMPHAPDAMYENETRFYRELRRELDDDDDNCYDDDKAGSNNGSGAGASVAGHGGGVNSDQHTGNQPPNHRRRRFETPDVYGTIYDARRHRYGVIMEDLRGAAAARFPNALSTPSLPLQSLRGVMHLLARLHAKFWQSDRFDAAAAAAATGVGGPGADLTWVPTPTKGGMYEVFHSLGRGLIADHVRSNSFEQVSFVRSFVHRSSIGRGCFGQSVGVPPAAAINVDLWLWPSLVGCYAVP